MGNMFYDPDTRHTELVGVNPIHHPLILSAAITSMQGDVVSSLQTVLTNGAPGEWNTTPQGIDGDFGPNTEVAVKAFQTWGGVTADGVVGDQAWSVSLHAASRTLETAVGLNFVID